jgi:hypothetical protein
MPVRAWSLKPNRSVFRAGRLWSITSAPGACLSQSRLEGTQLSAWSVRSHNAKREEKAWLIPSPK